MSRVELLNKDKAQPQAREVFEKMEANGAEVINLYRGLAHSPQVMLNLIRLGNALLTRAKLAPRLRELTILRIARITGCEYEWSQHYTMALEVGITEEQAERIGDWQTAGCFSDEDRAVLQFVDEVANNVAVTDATFEEVRKYLDEQEIVDLTMSVGHWGTVARFTVALQIDVDSLTSTSNLTGKKKGD